jgi:lipopolysaccharide assembly outer membrane protein LptD (OstA)
MCLKYGRKDHKKSRARFVIWLLLYITAIPHASIFAQEALAQEGAAAEEAAASEAETPQARALSEQQRILELDIKTSTLLELAEWSREMGLGEGGTKEELAARLRNHYALPYPEAGAQFERIITIENARTTEYFTLEAVDEEYARLSGGVKLSLKDGEAIHSIEAWEILYNRTRNIVSASGGVNYKREEGGTVETFTGEAIILNLDTWVGSFLDTVSERSISNADTAYRFAGQVISKTDSDTTVLKRAVVSNAKSDEPYWSLSATRIWLFPGSDWALFNAVLKVGEVPVLYLPFFVYPADEVVFHPVLGTRTRHGYYVQTTTYLLGRPVPDPSKQNSISKILGTADGMEKTREGFFLRSTGKPETRPNDKILSVSADAYSNLGFGLGVNLTMPKHGFLNNLKINTGLGFTRTLFYRGLIYTPYQLNDEKWESEWNGSHFFGMALPLRYKFNAETSISGKFGTLELKLPLYSDPFIDDDLFKNRSEEIDWMALLKGGTLEDQTVSTTYIGSYQWNLTLRPNIATTFFSPYISRISINSVSTFISFIQSRDLSRDSGSNVSQYDPERQFFIPEKLTAYSISTSISGSPISINGGSSGLKEEPKNPLKGIGEVSSPWAAAETGADGSNKVTQSQWSSEIKPPVVSQTITLPRANLLRFSTNYSFNPSSATEMQYFTDKFNTTNKGTAKDVDLGDFESMLTNFRTDGSLNFTLSEASNNLFSTTLGFSGSYQWQDTVYHKDDIADSRLQTLRLANYRGTQWTINSSYNFTLNPFYSVDMLKSSNLQYSLGGLVARSLFDEAKYSADRAAHSGDPKYYPVPEWKLSTIEWEREYISSHRVAANFGINVLDKVQNLSFSADIPPLYRAYNSSATMRVWIWESNASMQIQEDTDENKAAAAKSAEKKYHYINGYIFRPLYLTQTFNLGTSRSARLYTVWDPELDEWTNLTVNFSYGTFSMAYAAVRMFKYFYDDNPASQGWKQETAANGKQQLYPRDFTISWSPTYRLESFFHNLFSLSVNARSGITIDLQRYTYSRFTFNLSFTLGISKFLDLTFNTASENAEIYRYMQDLPFFADLRDKQEVGLGKENNFILDLLNSFRFDNEELRKMSGFKLKSFGLSAVHHLGDWDATVSIALNPYLDGMEYKFRTTFSFLVQWLPITEIEARVDYENEKFIRKQTN